MATLEQLGAEKYVLLTTFRKDGRAVGTPIWAVPHGSGLMVWTPTDTGKVKRIRNSGRVTVQACDLRGNPTSDEVVEGHARIGDESERAAVVSAINKKYGVLGWVTTFGSRLRRGTRGTVALVVT